MAGPAPTRPLPRDSSPRELTEPRWVRVVIIAIALAFLALFLVLPLVAIFAEALSGGVRLYVASLTDPEALSAIQLTLLVTAIVVPVNLAFGLCAGWAVGKFRFAGRGLLVSLIDVPFAVSPVIAGLVFVLLFGAQGWFGPWLREHDVKVIFALPGIVLATLFVTLPFVARELITLMEEQGTEDEQAALSLGASGWQTFLRVTLPSVKWALLYGVILSSARAMGEFGAVSVVSGHIRGRTTTMPLHIEVLHGDYQFAAAFAVASLLSLLALVTLGAKTILESRVARQRQPAQEPEDQAAGASGESEIAS